ncbi:MAG: beta-mannosidase [Chloroflexi bacterium]|nr:MAG: beta-mannosidase [Chloroflexota bacterium]
MASSRIRALSVIALLATSGVLAATPHLIATAAGAVGTTTIGTGGWEVQSSSVATQTGAVISTPGFNTSAFFNVTPDDAGAPGTEVEAVLQHGECPNVFFSNNMQTCLGYMASVGRETVARFSVPWWFRTDFNGALAAGQDATLIINGVVGQADVWLNGQEIATQATVQGDFTRYTFDITSRVLTGDNALAFEVYPNNPTAMYTLDDVDWNQIPPDNNTGIQFPVQLHLSNSLGLDNSHVNQSNAADMSSSALTVKADVTNHSASAQSGTVTVAITAPGGTSPFITVSQTVNVPANTTQTVTFTPGSYPSLNVTGPQVWWPYQMGAQPLYTLAVSLSQTGLTTETQTETFGIRTVTTSLIGASSMTPNGVRVFAINGRRFIFRGGGWSENLFLHYSSFDTAAQIFLMKSMGVNGIRTEGHQMPADFYQQMDQAGLMVDGGYQCCDFWETNTSLTTAQAAVYQNSALTIGQNIRNHPSVINWSWSDNAPSSQQETLALNGFTQSDFYPANPIISSAEYKADPQGTLGPSGEKEGPYDWVPPSYWYDTTHFASGDLTNQGGSWGFDSEESGGDTVPTIDSINRFLSASDQATLWQSPRATQYHTNYESGNKGYHFGSLVELDSAIQARYGSWSSLAQYVREAQVQNYEDTRAQFEAFIDHWNNAASPSTGTVYWQMNKGWPTLLWALYNNDYDQAGSYFGAKKGNSTLHALYAMDNGTVTVDNLGGATQSGVTVTSTVYDINSNVLDRQTSASLSVGSQVVVNGVLTPRVPATGSTPVQTYFVELVMSQGGATIERNVYWLSTQADIVNWSKSLGQPKSTISQYANLTALNGLAAGTVSVTASTSNGTTTVTITNTSTTHTVAFFVRADVRRGTTTGTELPGDNEVLPIAWSDNDITLFPGESQTLTATYNPSLLQGATPVVSIQGWNLTRFDVVA